MFFQHPGFSQHPRCFISTCGVFPAPEKQGFCSIRKVFFEDQVFSPHPEVFFSASTNECFLSTQLVFFEHQGVFSTPAVFFFSTSAMVFSQLQNGVFPAPKVFFQHPNGVFCAKAVFFSAPQQCFSSAGKRETQRQTQRRRR